MIPVLPHPSLAEAHPCCLCLWRLFVSYLKKKDKNDVFLLLEVHRLAWEPAQVWLFLLGFHIALPRHVWTSPSSVQIH